MIRLAGPADLAFLRAHDAHVPGEELAAIVGRGRVDVAVGDDGQPVGLLRWGLFWDEIPFMNLLLVVPEARGRGLGTALVRGWEAARGVEGYRSVMTSTLSDETAQHLYRRLGYSDCGALFLPGEAAEILLRKELG